MVRNLRSRFLSCIY